jgi:alpha-aminoadipate/glutamate carrier protein LysW
MAVEFTVCPQCRQRLAVMDYLVVGAQVVCANEKCGTSLRITARRPLQVAEIAEDQTYVVDYRPEAYG